MATITPEIYTRSGWGAAADTRYMEAYTISPKYIVIHHSGRSQTGSDGAEMRFTQYDHMTKTPSWGDIGYNWGIGKYGSIMEGRSMNYKGAHCSDTIIYANRNSIGIYVFGDTSKTSVTSEQFDSLISIVAYLCKKYSISTNNILGHKDLMSTECPGNNLYSNLGYIKTQAQILLNNNTSKKYLNLYPHMASWRVYPTNVAPVIGNECVYLAPATYGGLSYEILGNPQTDVYTIQTQSFGRVNIYAPRDNDSSITTSPLY